VALRHRFDLPTERFVILLSSRISHEKDPETVLRATALVRAKGLDAVLINLGGGYRQFLDLARELSLPEAERWVLWPSRGSPDGRIWRTIFGRWTPSRRHRSPKDSASQRSRRWRAARQWSRRRSGEWRLSLTGFARLTPRRDAEAMANEIHWIGRSSG